MYATHRPMLIYSGAKYGMTMSKDKKAVAGTFRKPYTVSYRDHEHMLHITSYSDRPMLQIRCYNIRASRMYVTHPLMVRDLCAKYGKLKVTTRTRRLVKTYEFYLRGGGGGLG